MATFYASGFKGWYPVPTSAIIDAESKEKALEILNKELVALGLHETGIWCLEEFSGTGKCIIISDGDY